MRLQNSVSSGVQLNSKLDWKSYMEAVYSNQGQRWLYSLKMLRAFNICQPFLRSVYSTVVASALFFLDAVCWGAELTNL